MKHILSLLLLLMCCVGFVSCGDDDDAPLLGSKVPGQWVLLKDGETEGDTLQWTPAIQQPRLYVPAQGAKYRIRHAYDEFSIDEVGFDNPGDGNEAFLSSKLSENYFETETKKLYSYVDLEFKPNNSDTTRIFNFHIVCSNFFEEKFHLRALQLPNK